MGWLAGLLPRPGGHQLSRSSRGWTRHTGRGTAPAPGQSQFGTKPGPNKIVRTAHPYAPAQPGPSPYTEPHWLVHGDVSCVNATQGFWAKSASVASKHHLPILCQHGLFHPMQTWWCWSINQIASNFGHWKCWKTIFFFLWLGQQFWETFCSISFLVFFQLCAPHECLGKLSFLYLNFLLHQSKYIYIKDKLPLKFAAFISFFFQLTKNSSLGKVSLGAFFKLQGDEALRTMQTGATDQHFIF